MKMRHMMGVVGTALAIGVLALGTTVLAVQRAKPGKVPERTVSGAIVKYEPTNRMLTLKTAKGEETFSLGSDVRIHEGAKTLAASDLEQAVGHNAKVRYAEANGQRTAHELSIAAAAPVKPARTRK